MSESESGDTPQSSAAADDADEQAATEPDETSSAQDLAAGLDLMLRAAKKAVKGIDTRRVEQAGRRAIHNIENLDARKAAELGKRAAKNLDPRKIEEIANDAGRELLSVVERVAERVERVVATRSSPPPAPESDEKKD